MRVALADAAATSRLAARFAQNLPPSVAGWCILLSGELGAGKSTFARALLAALGHAGPVPSPTYTLVEPYDTSKGSVYHIDLYRISSEEELHFLGFEELDEGLRLIEWPERVAELKALADVRILLEYEGAGRLGTLTGLSRRGADLVAALAGRVAELQD